MGSEGSGFDSMVMLDGLGDGGRACCCSMNGQKKELSSRLTASDTASVNRVTDVIDV